MTKTLQSILDFIILAILAFFLAKYSKNIWLALVFLVKVIKENPDPLLFTLIFFVLRYIYLKTTNHDEYTKSFVVFLLFVLLLVLYIAYFTNLESFIKEKILKFKYQNLIRTANYFKILEELAMS